MAYTDVDEDTVHHICIQDGFGHPVIPPLVAENIRSFEIHQTGFSHKLWGGEEVRTFIADRFSRDVVRSFDRIRPYSYKCDLARLCVIFEFGGIYADLGIKMIERFTQPDNIGFAAFRSYSFLTTSWVAISNGIFYSQPKRRELQISIENIVSNCKTGHHGVNPLEPTGPVLFGRAIAAAMLENLERTGVDDQWIGEVRHNPDGSGTMLHVAPHGRTICINTKAGRTMPQLGLVGSNTYGDAWAGRRVYEPVDADRG